MRERAICVPPMITVAVGPLHIETGVGYSHEAARLWLTSGLHVFAVWRDGWRLVIERGEGVHDA